jgi:cytochrome c556
MPRKRTTLAAVMTAVALAFTGLALAAQEEGSPLEKMMETINRKNLALKKMVRTKVAFSKAKTAEFKENSDAMITEAKKARAEKGPAEKQKKTYEEWTKLMDDFIAKTGAFQGVATKPGVTFEATKKSYDALNKSCTNCHNVFRVDEPE